MTEYNIPITTSWTSPSISTPSWTIPAIATTSWTIPTVSLPAYSIPPVDTFYFDEYAIDFDVSEEWFNATRWAQL